MTDREKLLRAAQDKRERAARARRWAQGLSLNADRERLVQHAREIEEEARQLEQQVAQRHPTAHRATGEGMQQVQQQQQHQAEPKSDGHKP